MRRMGPVKRRLIKKRIRGAISLFLCVLLMPFVTIALLLVQAAHFNSALTVLDEAMGVSANATLANYDNYIQKRFGLYAMGQTTKDDLINDVFKHYFDTNSKVLGGLLNITDVSAGGSAPLSDTAVLRRQLNEFNKLNAPVTLAAEALNIDDIVSELEKKMGGFESFLKILDSGIDAANSTKDAYDHIEKAKTHAENLEATGSDSLRGKYEAAYNELEKAVKELSEALPEPESSESDEDKEKKAEITRLRKKVEDKKKAYIDSMTKLQEELKAHSDEMNGFNDSIKEIKDAAVEGAVGIVEYNTVEKCDEIIDAKKDELKALTDKEKNGTALTESEKNTKKSLNATIKSEEEKKTQLSQQIAQGELVESTADKLTSHISEDMKSYNENTASLFINSLEKQKTEVKNINSSGSSIEELSKSKYYSENFTGYISSQDLGNYLLKQAEEMADNSLTSLIDAVVGLCEALVDIDVFYNPEYAANIDTAFYNELGGLPGSDDAKNPLLDAFVNMGNIVGLSAGIGGKLVSLDIVGAILDIVNIFTEAVSFVENIIEAIADIVISVTQIFTGYEKLYLSTYSTFNMACRTDSKAKMTGTTPKLPTQHSVNKIPVVGEISSLISTMQAAAQGTGSDLAFNGAELEYIMVGSNYELLNQSIVFAELYFIRLLLDVIPVVTNSEIGQIAGATGPFAPLVYLLVLLAEPLADTLMLVNGGDVPLIKTKLYISPSGIGVFVDKFVESTIIGDDGVNKITENLSTGMFGEVGVTAKSVGIYDMDYRDHCFVLTLVTVPISRQAARIANIIQMEGTYHYGRESGFRVSQAYTIVKSEADVKVKQFLPSILSESVFSSTRTQYRGY